MFPEYLCQVNTASSGRSFGLQLANSSAASLSVYSSVMWLGEDEAAANIGKEYRVHGRKKTWYLANFDIKT